MIEASNGIIRDAYSNQYTAEELAGRAESAILAAGRDLKAGSTSDAASMIDRAWARVESRRGGEFIGTPTNFDAIDGMLGGCMGNSEFIILGGRPGQGKTALGLGIAERAVLGLTAPTLYVSLEMATPELGERMISGLSGVPGYILKKSWELKPHEDAALAEARRRISASPLLIEEDASLSMLAIASLARREKAARGIGLLIVDYLQLIDRVGDEDNGRQSRQEVVSRISRKFKMLAKELEIPVLALCQLNRESEGRSDKRPMLSDLRESGSLEQDADVVLLVHRPEYYDATDQPGIAEVIVAKNRNGATGKVQLAFRSELARMENLVRPLVDF